MKYHCPLPRAEGTTYMVLTFLLKMTFALKLAQAEAFVLRMAQAKARIWP